MAMIGQRIAAGALAAVGMSGAVVGAAASPAFAGPLAPQCVTTSTSSSGVVTTFLALNNCSYTVKVKFIIAFHVDSGCYTIKPGGGLAYLEELNSC
ncbi:hypothetical protein [Luedemannella helvata]|uniref:Uncharacterized protein n=1 Tax=Luedemannella helvata TaxID=349315 RepID=A0ABP4XAN1_9ACTN